MIPPLTENWKLTKPFATGRRGIVVSQARVGAEAGVAVLEAGGNAVDAAVAAIMVLASQEPWNSGLGGYGGFAVIHRAGQARAEVVDFGPVSPRNLTTANFRLTGRTSTRGFRWAEVEGDANVHGPLAVAVPAAVAGCERMHVQWGRLPIAEVMAPAVALAKQGLQLDWFATLKIAAAAEDLRRYDESARIYLRDGLPPVPPAEGSPGRLKLGNLAATIEQLARAGWRDFYEGEIARAFVRDQARVGGVIDAEDLRACAASVVPAMQVPWRGGRVLQLAPGMNASPAMAPVLAAMAGAAFGARPDAAWYRLLAAELKAAYGARLGARAGANETCTTHLTVCDAEGTMVSMTTTLMAGMGSRVVLPETGMLMNNGIMLFDPRPGLPNSIAPGKRLLTNMLPLVLREGDRPVLAAGASGGRHIMAAVFQLMAYVADFGMSVEEAAHHPRISVAGPDRVVADVELGEEVIAALQADGPVEVVRRGLMPTNFANPNLIEQLQDGVRSGSSDNRSPWSAAVAQ
jgi:gamma-glutamyltranspeptidase/glutathione hydrolase